MAYCICDRRYQLSSKKGMDFYALAHEYYLKLALGNWKQLNDRKPGVSLRTWMINGFRYIVLDRLKALQTEFRTVSLEDRLADTRIAFDVADNHFKEDFHQTIDEICEHYYHSDRKAQAILRMMLIDGMKGKEIAAQLGITPSAVTQRYHQMMNTVIVPYFNNYYSSAEAMGDVQYSRTFEEMVIESCESASPMPEERPAERGSIFSFNRKKKRIMEKDIRSRGIADDTGKSAIINRTTPDMITSLRPGEIFVFGSNLRGMHAGGAAYAAYRKFGAIMGQGVGLQGQSYAIPTMQGGPETIQPYVDEFIDFAREHSELTFLVTRIGCGIAGFDATDIAPLFTAAISVENIHLPQDFWELLR
ncbi:MAG: transcriptional regulator [Prevotella sp.]|nr:transcriptional regulator [Prevotella sp.]